MRWSRHVTRAMGNRRERNHLDDGGVHWRIILKIYIQEIGWVLGLD